MTPSSSRKVNRIVVANSAQLRAAGLSARNRGDRQAALEHFKAAAAINPTDLATQHDIAAELQGLGRLDEAEAAYHVVLSRDPGFSHALRGLGQIARKRGDRTKAFEYFQAAVAAKPTDAWSQHELADELAQTGRQQEAEAAFRKLLELDPSFYHAHRGLGQIARNRGDRQAALEHFKAAAAINPTDLWSSIDLAAELRELNRDEEAENICLNLVRENPHSSQPLIELAKCARSRGDTHRVVDLLTRSVIVDPSHLGAKIALADEYRDRWRLEEADQLYNAVLSKMPGNYWALMGKGHAARRRGDRQSAQKYFKMAHQSDAGQPWAPFELATEFREAGLFADARQIIQSMLSERQNEFQCLMHLAYLDRAEGYSELATQGFAKIIELYPLQPQPYIDRATEEFYLGRPQSSQQLLNAALRNFPRHPGIIDALANHARLSDNIEGALDLYRKASSINPTQVWPALNIARCLASLGHSSESLRALETFRNARGPLPEWYIVTAEILKSIGEPYKSRELLDEGRRSYPTHFYLWFQSAMLNVELGAFKSVEDELKSLPPHSFSEVGRVFFVRGALALAKWDLPTARSQFLRALNHNKRDGWTRQRVVQTTLFNLDTEAAKVHLREFAKLTASENALRGFSTNISQSHYGQLLDEFQLDTCALQQLSTASALTEEKRIDALLAAVLRFPDYTPAAMLLLIELRRQGYLTSAAKTWGGKSVIPNTVIQYWDTEKLPDDVAALSETWRANNPEMTYTCFSDAGAQMFLKAVGEPATLRAYQRAKEPAMKADIFRLAYLYHRGGYYVDADDRSLAPISTIDAGGYGLLLYQEDIGSLGNNFIGATLRQPIIGRALAHATEAVNRGDADILWLATGPGLLSRTFASILAEAGANWRSVIAETVVLDRHELLKILAMHCVTSYKHTVRHWSRTAFGARKRLLGTRAPV